MEDAHTTLLEVDSGPHQGPFSFFAVYDGHGGSNAARFAGQYVHSIVTSQPEFTAGNWRDAMKAGFLASDVDLRKGSVLMPPQPLIPPDPTHLREPSGCTAVAVLITPGKTIVCANAGDSRAILSCAGVAVPLSFDHKPSNQCILMF